MTNYILINTKDIPNFEVSMCKRKWYYPTIRILTKKNQLTTLLEPEFQLSLECLEEAPIKLKQSKPKATFLKHIYLISKSIRIGKILLSLRITDFNKDVMVDHNGKLDFVMYSFNTSQINYLLSILKHKFPESFLLLDLYEDSFADFPETIAIEDSK